MLPISWRLQLHVFNVMFVQKFSATILEIVSGKLFASDVFHSGKLCWPQMMMIIYSERVCVCARCSQTNVKLKLINSLARDTFHKNLIQTANTISKLIRMCMKNTLSTSARKANERQSKADKRRGGQASLLPSNKSSLFKLFHAQNRKHIPSDSVLYIL